MSGKYSSLDKILDKKNIEVSRALELFDRLEPVTVDFLLGKWSGFEIQTGHPIDGLLGASGWSGKEFKSSEEVHPLLVRGFGRNRLYPLNPGLVPLSLPLPKFKIMGLFIKLLEPLYNSSRYRARLRMMEYRGKLTATMVYDQKPINDHFVKIDENTILGLMDWKKCDKPYVFVLERL